MRAVPVSRSISRKRDRLTAPQPRKRRGFSAFELLMVLGVVAAVAGVTLPIYRQYQITSDLDIATQHLVQALRNAQTYAQANRNDSMWGVYALDATLFAGESYDLRIPDYDQAYPLAPTIQTAGLSEVVFSQIEGVPSEVGIITVTSSLTDLYREITIDGRGSIFVSGLKEGAPPAMQNSSSSGILSSPGGQGSGGDESSAPGLSSAGGQAGGGSSDATSSSGTGGGASTSSPPPGGDTGGSSSSPSGDTSSSDGGGGGGGESGDDEDECGVYFTLNGGQVTTVGTNDIRFKVLGSEITYGAGGPRIPVRVSLSLDGGSAWSDLFHGDPIEANDEELVPNIPSATQLVLRFNGRYSWLFNKTYRSDNSGDHVLVFRNGDRPPNYQGFGRQASAASILQPILDADGRISIGPRDLVFLVELGALDRVSADFQDAVVLATFIEKPQTCTEGNVPRFKVSFNRLENTGNGDAANRVFVGPQSLAFAEEQWVPLVDGNGNAIIDNGIQSNVSGLAAERGNGWVRVRLHGFHAEGAGKELVDARVLFNKAIITSIENETGQYAAEFPRDGVTNDTPAGDEFEDGPNAKSMVFHSRVTPLGDGAILHWVEGQPSDASDGNGTSSSGGTGGGSSAGGGGTVSSAAGEDPACAVPFDVASDGSVNIHGSADIALRVAGSESTFGYNGPRMSVRSRVSFDDGSSWRQLFGYRAIRAGDSESFFGLAPEARLLLEFSGRYSWLFRSVVQSGTNDTHIRVLRRGDLLPNLPLMQRNMLREFLRQFIDENGRVAISSREVLYLAELGDVDRTADFQDAVAVVTINRATVAGCMPAGSISSQGGGQSSSVAQSTGSSASSVVSSSASSSSSSLGNGDGDTDTVVDRLDMCPRTELPEDVPTEYLTFNRFALTERARGHSIPIYREGPRRRLSEYTIEDTLGCSCDQLLNVIDGSAAYRFNEKPELYRQLQNLFSFFVTSSRKFGCGESLIRLVQQYR